MVCLGGLGGQFFIRYCNLSIFSNARKILHIHQPSHLNIWIAQFSMCKDLQTLRPCDMRHYCTHFDSNIWKLLVFFKKSHIFMDTLKAWNPFINHMTRILRGLLLNLKIYRALKYILLNSIGIDPSSPPPSHSHKNQGILLCGQKM
jgi:hypothetical protein